MSKLFTLQEIDKKPFSSFKDYIAKHNRRYGNKFSKYAQSRRIVCPDCGGVGEGYNPRDRDPIEGYKMAEKERCIKCEGSGEWSIDQAEMDYDLKILQWKRNRKLQKDLRTDEQIIVDFLRSNLNPRDLKILKTICRR
jgi:hypothetical protein